MYNRVSTEANNRVLRGGSWNNNRNNCRTVNRNNNSPDNSNNNFGFRLQLRNNRDGFLFFVNRNLSCQNNFGKNGARAALNWAVLVAVAR